jgi:hypothetical protein
MVKNKNTIFIFAFDTIICYSKEELFLTGVKDRNFHLNDHFGQG